MEIEYKRTSDWEESNKKVFDGFYEAFRFIQNVWDTYGLSGNKWGDDISTQDGLSTQATNQSNSLPIPHGVVLLQFADPRNRDTRTNQPMPSSIMVAIGPRHG